MLVSRLLHRVRAKLAASAFSRNVSVMLLGTVLGQAMSVLLSPALTRVFSPTEFGVLSVYMSSLNIIVVLSAMRYEIAIATARTASDAINLVALSTVVLGITTTIVAVASLVTPVPVLERFGLQTLANFRLLLPVGFVLFGFYYILLFFVTWAQQFNVIARTRISQGFTGPLMQIVLGLLGLGSTGLAIGFIIGQSSGMFLMLNETLIKRAALLREISPRRMLHAAWLHRGFPLIASWAGVIDQAGAGQLIYILLTAYYPGPVTGFMFLAERLAARPLAMVSTSMLTVFTAELRRAIHDDPKLMGRRFMQVTSRQLMVGVAWVVIIDSAAALTFPIVFGQNWADAVPFLVVMSVAYLVNSVVASVGNTLQVLRRQVLAATWQLSRVAAVCLGFAFAVYRGLPPLQAVAIYSAVQVVMCSLLLAMMKSSIERAQTAGAPQAA